MKWTTKKPTKPGFYWFRALEKEEDFDEWWLLDGAPTIERVTQDDIDNAYPGSNKITGEYFGWHGDEVVRQFSLIPEPDGEDFKWGAPSTKIKNLKPKHRSRSCK